MICSYLAVVIVMSVAIGCDDVIARMELVSSFVFSYLTGVSWNVIPKVLFYYRLIGLDNVESFFLRVCILE